MKHLAPLSLSSGQSLRRFLGVAAVTTLASAAAAGTLGSAAWASAAARPATTVSYSFRTLNNHHDQTFNQLLGINNEGLIAGYFGSGAKGHPNKGYRLSKPYSQGNYANENYPGSGQTQVTGLNDTAPRSGSGPPEQGQPGQQQLRLLPARPATSTRSTSRPRAPPARRWTSSSA